MASDTNKTRFIFTALLTSVTALLLSWPATNSQQRPKVTQSSAITIDHVALHVSDLDASVAFYSGLFGLQEIPAAAKGRRWLSLGKGVALHLLGGRTQPVADVRSV